MKFQLTEQESLAYDYGVGNAYADAISAIADNNLKELKDILSKVDKGEYEYYYENPKDLSGAGAEGTVQMQLPDFILGNLPDGAWDFFEKRLGRNAIVYSHSNLIEAALDLKGDNVNLAMLEYLTKLAKDGVDQDLAKSILYTANQLDNEEPYLRLLKILKEQVYNNVEEDSSWIAEVLVPFLKAVKANKFDTASQILAKGLNRYDHSSELVDSLVLPGSEVSLEQSFAQNPVFSKYEKSIKRLIHFENSSDIYEAIAFWKNPKAMIYLILHLNDLSSGNVYSRERVLDLLRKYVAPYSYTNRRVDSFFDLLYGFFQNPKDTSLNSERMNFAREYGIDPINIVSYKNVGDSLYMAAEDFFSKLGYRVRESLKKSIISSLYKL